MKTKTLYFFLVFLISLSGFAQIIDDNFDMETIGTLPTGWVIKYEGTGTANQKVVNTTSVSTDNSFELQGKSGWSATIIKKPDTIPDKVSLEGYVKAEKILSGDVSGIGLTDPDTGTWGTYCADVRFYDGKIVAYTYPGHIRYTIQDYNINQWYHIKIEADLIDETFEVYIDHIRVSGTKDGVSYDKFPMVSGVKPTHIHLTGGNGGTAKSWFDDIKLYQNDSLVAYYPFNGNANDESINANHGTVYGAILTDDRQGNPNSAYYFDGENDYILCEKEVGPFGNQSRSFSFWAKTDVEPVANKQQNSVLSYGGNIYDGGSRFEILLNPKCRGIGVDVSSKYRTWSFDNSDNGWHFYTVVFDNSISNNLSDLKFYADGELLLSECNNNGGDMLINTKDEQVLNIGRLFYSGQPRYFKGSIDEIRIYNKALSQQEITELYNEAVAAVKNFVRIDRDVFIYNNRLFLKNNNQKTYKELALYNMTGQQIFKSAHFDLPIDLNFLKNGIYIVKLIHNETGISVRKFIIHH